ncbi:hypothetical protein J616_03457 [Acinetobacter baumannii 1457504]|nr:hypothetical protein J616_03457 [Acinetobacter baumannii 1457504]
MDGDTVTATATDPAGNTSLPGTGTVSADITAPVVALDDVLTNDRHQHYWYSERPDSHCSCQCGWR